MRNRGVGKWVLSALVAMLVVALTACGGGGGGGGGTPAPVGTVPNAPTNLVGQVLSATSVDLTWTDASTNETSFTVERAVGTGAFTAIQTGIAANSTTATDTLATASTQYSYRVKAVNGAGASLPSNEVLVTTSATPTTPPTAPTNLIATAVSSSSISIQWTDNSNNEDGFRIERSTTSGSGFAQIDTVSTSVATYSAVGLTASTTYYFRVRAYNTASTPNSAYTNESNATTQTSGPTGPSWSAAIIVSGNFPPTNSAPGFSSSNSGDGAAHLFWSAGTSAYHVTYNGAWTSPALISNGTIVSGAGNAMHLVQKNTTSGDLEAQAWNGTSWSSLATISGSFKPTNTTTVFEQSHSGDGTPHLFWVAGSSYVHVAYKAGAWTSPVSVTARQIVSGAGNAMYLLNGGISGQTWDGTSWSTLTPISGSFTPSNPLSPFSTGYPVGRPPHIFWGSGQNAYHSAPTTTGWTNPVDVTGYYTVSGKGDIVHLARGSSSGLFVRTWK